MSTDHFDISWDPLSGTLKQSGIRYVLMRPDVVMGAARHLPDARQYIDAIAASAFEHARASFAHYADNGAIGDRDPVEHGCEMAGQLGWGVWTIESRSAKSYLISVRNSPFAIAAAGLNMPMCGWISGVLTALLTSVHGGTFEATETQCSSQGHDVCRFQLSLRN